MSQGLATNISTGSTTIGVSDPISLLTINVPVSVVPAFAWAQSAPLASALVSDTGAGYASTSALRSNSKSLYAAGFSTETSLDSGITYNGNPTIANDRTVNPTNSQFIIPSFGSQTDIVYHVRRRTDSVAANDLVPGVSYSNFPSGNNGTLCVIAGLQFDPGSYSMGMNDYGSGDQPSGVIALMTEYVHSTLYVPKYRLVASVFDLTPTRKSDATSFAGVMATTLGDEMFNTSYADYFIRAHLVGTTLNIEAYMGTALSAPKQIATLALTMLDASTPPMPKYALGMVREPYFLTPAVSRVAFHQIISNSANPNTALDFGNIVTAGGVGLGDHGASIVKRTVNIQQYASDAAFKTAGTSSRFNINSPTNATLVTTSDAAHNNQKYMRMTQTANTFAPSCGIDDDPWQAYQREFWVKESWLFGAGWTTYGAGKATTTITQNITSSGSPQTITVASTSGVITGNNYIGYGTANAEVVNVTSVGAGSITATFTKNHTSGDEVAVPQGPGYKIYQTDFSVNGTANAAASRLEIVGTDFDTYYAGAGSWDSSYPCATDAGLTGGSVGSTTTHRVVATVIGTASDVTSTPANNIQGATGRSGTRSGQTVELQFRARHKVWYDSDYGRWKTRVEQYLGYAGSAPSRYQMIEAFCDGTITDISSNAVHYGENYNERPMSTQTLDRWDQEVCDPNIASVGADPYGVVAALSLAVPAAGTCASATSPTTTTLTYPITAPGSGATVLHVIAEVYNGTYWIPNGTGIAWTMGAAGTQNITVTGLTTGTNYTGKIRFRLVSSYGVGAAVVCTNGTTS